MISRLGLVISRAFQRTAPDPFVLAILLTVVTAVLALLLGFPESTDGGWLRGRVAAAGSLLDAWRSADGLWKLLGFAMQMSLILVTGHAVASAPLVRPALDRLARRPTGTASAAAMVAVVAGLAGLLNWGLGLIVGAILARDAGASLARRGIPHHYPLICAAGYSTMLLWHGGLSGSAPLTMTSAAAAGRVLPDDLVRTAIGEGIPLTETIFSPMNLVVTGGLLVLVPLVLALLAPRAAESIAAPADLAPVDPDPPELNGNGTIPDRLGRSRLLSILLVVPLVLALVRFARVSGLGSLGLNEINTGMLALGLLLHGSPLAYAHAVDRAIRGCAGILLQFPLYAGIMGMMVASGLVGLIAETLTSLGGERTLPLLTFLSAGVVNLFVPSGGGQWAVQGPIALTAGADAGIPAGKMIMSVAYGDELTNMLQPFWALPLLAITRVEARDIVGYTAIVMVIAALWMAMGLLLF